MFRKLTIALTATAALAAAALAPTAASAWPHHHHHGFGWGYGAIGAAALIGAATVAATSAPAAGCYYVKRWVDTPVGPRPRYVPVCY
jgi:hypothetical protein